MLFKVLLSFFNFRPYEMCTKKCETKEMCINSGNVDVRGKCEIWWIRVLKVSSEKSFVSVSDNNNYYNGSMISDRTDENSDPHCLNMNCLDENIYKFFHLRFVLFGPAGKVELYWHLNFRFLNSEPLMILSIVELALFRMASISVVSKNIFLNWFGYNKSSLTLMLTGSQSSNSSRFSSLVKFR